MMTLHTTKDVMKSGIARQTGSLGRPRGPHPTVGMSPQLNSDVPEGDGGQVVNGSHTGRYPLYNAPVNVKQWGKWRAKPLGSVLKMPYRALPLPLIWAYRAPRS